jgi:hypothetical protein
VNDIPITVEFDDTRSAGRVQINSYAKKLFENMAVKGVDYVLSPAFIVKRKDDGIIKEVELISLSMIPAGRAVKREVRY